LLRQIFVFAENEDFIIHNPFAKAKKIISTAAEVQRDRILGFEEESLLLKACDNENRKHLIPLIITAVDTAMRKGELLKLIWNDVDFDEEAITVRATNAKTEKMRVIGMTSRVKAELSQLWENSPKDSNSSVFGLKSNFKRSWHSALKQTGINNLHFHDLRHTAITRMIRAGISASEVMKISGHTEMKTFKRYVNLTNESVRASANRLEEFYMSSAIKPNHEIISEIVN
jgi:integrase